MFWDEAWLFLHVAVLVARRLTVHRGPSTLATTTSDGRREGSALTRPRTLWQLFGSPLLGWLLSSLSHSLYHRQKHDGPLPRTRTRGCFLASSYFRPTSNVLSIFVRVTVPTRFEEYSQWNTRSTAMSGDAEPCTGLTSLLFSIDGPWDVKTFSPLVSEHVWSGPRGWNSQSDCFGSGIDRCELWDVGNRRLSHSDRNSTDRKAEQK